MDCPPPASKPSSPDMAHCNKGANIRDREGLHFLIQFLDKFIPVFKADFEYLAILDLRYPDKIEMRVSEITPVWDALNKLEF